MKRATTYWLAAALTLVTAPASLLAAPIQDAAQKGDINSIRTLLSAGGDVNAKDENGGTPLLYAAIRNQKATVEFLLNHGAKTDIAAPDGGTALHLAARYGETEIVSSLLAHDASVDTQASNGMAPLHLAARYGSLEVTRLLVEHGANVNVSEHDGFTPLIYATALGQTPIVEYLLSKGANANAVTKSARPPRTALGLAAWNRYTNESKYQAIIKQLLSHGAKDNWLSAVPGFDPEKVSGLLLKQGPNGTVMSGSIPFFLSAHTAVRPWKDPGTSTKKEGGTNFFVWDQPPNGDQSVTLIAMEDQRGNKSSAVALLPAYIGDGGIVYNDGVSAVGSEGPFVKLDVYWRDTRNQPVSGGHLALTRKGETVDLITDQHGTATYLLKGVTTNEPVTVAFNQVGGASKKVDLDCVIRGATEAGVQMVINWTN